MELLVKGQFLRDLSAYKKNTALLTEVYRVANEIERAKNAAAINNIIKLRKYIAHYRIRVYREYRMGLIIRHNKVWLVRFGHRNTFYSKFP